MSAELRRDDGPELNEIVSSLADSEKLQTLIEELHAKLDALQAADEWGEARDQHFEEVDRLADYLMQRDHFGGFERWDWAAQFLTNDGFRDLYDNDKHWMFDDFVKDDVDEFLADPNWETRAKTMRKRELESLLTVMSHFQSADWGPQMLRVQRLIAA